MRVSRLISAVLGLAVLLCTTIALATPRLEVTHVQGRDAPWVGGWNEAVVTLDNTDLPAWRGEVVVDPAYDRKSSDRPAVRVPVTLAAGEGARLLVPFYVNAGTSPSVVLTTAGEGEVASITLGVTRTVESVSTIVEIQGALARGGKLVDIPPVATDEDDTIPSAPIHKGWPRKPIPKPPSTPTPIVPPITLTPATPQVAIVQMARETGDPILADVSAGWSGAVMVVVPSDILSRLKERQLDALMHWTLSGGILAVSVIREEDLRAQNLKTLLGGEARMTSTAGGEKSTFIGAGLRRGDVSKSGDDGDLASYGLGEVWLLRRDPWARTPDTQAAKTMYALWTHARERRNMLMSLPAGSPVRWDDDDRIRKILDPNHGFRPALGIAAVLVVIYAFFVGPVAFSRARRNGRPLSVLKLTPICAFVLFLVLVGIGKVGKGFRGRIRKISIVDVAGGATKGSATTFHAFYVSDPNSIELSVKRPTDTVHLVEPFVDNAPIDLERTGMAVRGVRSYPWQTVVISEESMRDFQGGVVLEGTGGRLTLTNNTPWTLEHVILHPETTASSPAKSRYFPKVKPGETVSARDGTACDRRLRPVPSGWTGGEAEQPLKGDKKALEVIDALEALTQVWTNASYPTGNFLPVAEPIMTAVIDMPTGKEAGFGIERDIVFVRVIGLGGGKGKGELEPEKPKGKESDL